MRFEIPDGWAGGRVNYIYAGFGEGGGGWINGSSLGWADEVGGGEGEFIDEVRLD